MVRVVAYLIIVGLLAFGAVWLADRPGEVVITWQGRRIDTSVMVLMMTVATVAVAAVMLWSLVRAVIRSPGLLARYIDTRRGVRGYRAVSQGLVAVGSGDARAARKFTDEAKRIAPNEPLTLLLSAQTAQLSGDRDAASSTFQQMAGRDDTKLLGLHGLFIEARRRGDPAAALLYAEEAAKQASIPPWAGQAVLEFRCVASDWSGALERLERNHKAGLVDKVEYHRQRAVLLTAQALALEDSDRDRAKALVLEAVKLAPTLVPAAALAGRMLGEAGEARKAGRIIEAAWVWNPHPDLADAYANVRLSDSARDRLARVQSLARSTPGHTEGALAVARAALDARDFAAARTALEPLAKEPTQRVAMLMAELENL
jgi:HemY protein